MSCRTVAFHLACTLAALLAAIPEALSQESRIEPKLTWFQCDLPDTENCFALTFDPANSQRALLGTRPGSLWESLDGGVSWTQKQTAIQSTPNHGVNAGGIAFHPRIPGLCYFGHEKYGAFRSRDNGKTWTMINDGLEYYAERHGICFAFDAREDNVVYYGADGGLFKSVDLGDHWTACKNGLPSPMSNGKRGNTTVSRFVVHPRTGAVYAGFYACGYGEMPGMYRSIDQGKNWECINHNFDGGVDQEVSAALIRAMKEKFGDKAGSELDAAYERVMKGEQLEGGFMKGWVFDVRMADANPDIIVAATNYKLIRSSNAGETWDSLPVVKNPRAVAIHPTDPSIMVASGTWETWITRDGGATWLEVSRNLANPPPDDPTQRPYTCFLTFSPTGDRIFALSSAGVWIAPLEDLK